MPYKVTTVSETSAPIPLVEGGAITQRLTEGKMQTFSYDIVREDTPGILRPLGNPET